MDALGAFDLSQYKCGQGINPDLPPEYKTLSIPEGENGIELLGQEMVGRIISAVNGLYKVLTLVGTDSLGLTLNQTKALHSVNCAMQNGGRETRHFVSAAWYGLRQFRQHEVALSYLNQYWGYVTTCEWESQQIVFQVETMMKQLEDLSKQAAEYGMEGPENPMQASYATKSVFASCDEFGQRAAALACNNAKQFCGLTPKAKEVDDQEKEQ